MVKQQIAQIVSGHSRLVWTNSAVRCLFGTHRISLLMTESDLEGRLRRLARELVVEAQVGGENTIRHPSPLNAALVAKMRLFDATLRRMRTLARDEQGSQLP